MQIFINFPNNSLVFGEHWYNPEYTITATTLLLSTKKKPLIFSIAVLVYYCIIIIIMMMITSYTDYNDCHDDDDRIVCGWWWRVVDDEKQVWSVCMQASGYYGVRQIPFFPRQKSHKRSMQIMVSPINEFTQPCQIKALKIYTKLT